MGFQIHLGAIAVIGGNTVPPLHVTGPVTLGELRLVAPGTQFIGGIGPLLFDNPGDAPAMIRTQVPRSPLVTTSLSTPIDIAVGETLLIDVTQPNSLYLQSSIIAETGTIEKHGAGRLALSGNNSAWGGDLIVRAGLVDVTYEDSLSNAARCRGA